MAHTEEQTLLEDEGAGYLVSVSDIMAGLLFVFIITLVAFVMQFQYASDKTELEQQILKDASDKTEREQQILKVKIDDLTNARELRKSLLSQIQDELKEQGVKVQIDLEQGILRLTEETIRFRTAKSSLDKQPKQNIKIISEVLAGLLPCYTGTPRPELKCRKVTQGKLEAVFIEGHTDNVPIKGSAYSNWELSAQRAINTYKYMRQVQPGLAELENSRDEPLFSVAGYADSRPQYSHDQPTDDARNRRIDMRFIMTPPDKDHEIVEEIHRQDVN
jgi:chemotaxis protein MotB